MNADLPWGLQLALAALAGLALGLLAMWLILRQSSAKQKAHEALAQQFSDYRHKVDQHFVDTAAAVDELNRSYQKVVQHLSAGAQTLMGKEALQEQLAQRSNKAVTVSYLAAASVEPLAQESDAGAAVQAAAAASEPVLPADKEIIPPPIDPEEQEPVSDVPVIDAPPTLAVEEDDENEPKAPRIQNPNSMNQKAKAV